MTATYQTSFSGIHSIGFDLEVADGYVDIPLAPGGSADPAIITNTPAQVLVKGISLSYPSGGGQFQMASRDASTSAVSHESEVMEFAGQEGLSIAVEKSLHYFQCVAGDKLSLKTVSGNVTGTVYVQVKDPRSEVDF